MAVNGAYNAISQAVRAWEGVTQRPAAFGATAYLLRKREIGHIHGDEVVDIPFPKPMRDRLVENGEAEPHRYLPGTGWVTVNLKCLDDVEKVIRLLRNSYDRLYSRDVPTPVAEDRNQLPHRTYKKIANNQGE